jgi:hypothetical protein
MAGRLFGAKRGDAGFSAEVLQAPSLFNLQLRLLTSVESFSFPFSNFYFLVSISGAGFRMGGARRSLPTNNLQLRANN